MNKFKNQPFFNVFIRFYLTFFIVVVLFKIIVKTFQSGFEAMKAQYLAPDQFQNFIYVYAVLAMFYGVFMTVYYKFIKK